MTGAGAIQCRYPMEFNLEKHFLLRKKVPFKKKVSWFFFFSLPRLLYLRCAPLSCYFLFQISTSFFSIIWSLVLYKKQTGPTSTPNSWSAPPISMGAMSRMGRREVFCDLYSITVLPHFPVCLCRARTTGANSCKTTSNYSRTGENEISFVSGHSKKFVWALLFSQPLLTSLITFLRFSDSVGVMYMDVSNIAGLTVQPSSNTA